MIWRRAVLPVVITYAGVMIVLVAAALAKPAVRSPRRAAWPAVLRYVATTAVGGYAVFMSGITVYCALRGVNVARCMSAPARDGLLIALSGTAGLVLFEVVARRFVKA